MMLTRPSASSLCCLAFLTLGSPPTSEAQTVRLRLADGRASLTATNATITEILAVWARVGRTTIVNADRIRSARQTLTILDEPEERALATILGSVSGYMAVRRSTFEAGASALDRIVVMATPPTASRGPEPVAVTAAPSAPPVRVVPRPQPVALTVRVTRRAGADGTPIADDQEGAPQPATIVGSTPVPHAGDSAPPASIAPSPSTGVMSVGSPRPGMVVR